MLSGTRSTLPCPCCCDRGAGEAVPPSSSVSVDHILYGHARARGWAARCCSTCSSRLGGAAAAGRTMVRSTAAPSPVLFRGILCSQIRGDDGARAVRPMMTSASPGRDGGDGDGAGRARSEVPGRRQRSPNSAPLTVGPSPSSGPNTPTKSSALSNEGTKC